MKKTSHLFLFFLFLILYFEIWHRYFISGSIWNIGIIYTILFSIPISLFLTFLSTLFQTKTNKKIIFTFTIFLTLLFAGNVLYYTLFSIPFSFHAVTLAGQAFGFFDIFYGTVLKKVAEITIFFLPLIYLIINKHRINYGKTFPYQKRNLIFAFLISYLISLISLLPGNNQTKSAFELYYNRSDFALSIKTFGLLTSERIDIKRLIFGFDESIIKDNNRLEKEEVEYNELEIDFDTLIKNDTTNSETYQFLKDNISTKKNNYTGKYQGKNIIFILAESYNEVAIDEFLTPTLYKLTHTGFNFNSFYSPVFMSTTGGEFQAMTGLLPTLETLNSWYKGQSVTPFSIGNIFSNAGYNPYAFHNWKYSFYNRNNTMPTLGFPNYLACENGLEKQIDCRWELNKPDDEEMIEATFPKFAENSPFATYYITLSGHSEYVLDEKIRNYEQVEYLPYSDPIKAYIANQMDLDQALELLINKLTEQGILDNTVIALVGDHYPYALPLDSINEISEYERDSIFEINHSSLILWNNETESIKIDKIGSQIDVLPTILNLFGLPYDSRLIIGNDILSDTEGLAIFSNMSWISDSGIYNSETKQFTPYKEVPEGYVEKTNNRVTNSFNVSKKIIDNNLYTKILES